MCTPDCVINGIRIYSAVRISATDGNGLDWGNFHGGVLVSPMDAHWCRVNWHLSIRLVCSGSWTNRLMIGIAYEPPVFDSGGFVGGLRLQPRYAMPCRFLHPQPAVS